MYYKTMKYNDKLVFKNVYSCPGMLDELVSTFTAIYDEVRVFFEPLEVYNYEGLGWVLLELLNNAVRAPISISMNTGRSLVEEIDFFGEIIVAKEINETHGKSQTVIVKIGNFGEYSEEICNSINELLSGDVSLLDCEERFRLKGSYTGNGGMGLLLSKKQVEKMLNGKFIFSWEDGYYMFSIEYPSPS